MRFQASLAASDKKVVEAFLDHRALSGKILDTDGKSLHKMWLGGEKVAVWRGPKIAVVSTESSRTDQSIIRYLVKQAGPSMVAFSYARGKQHPLSIRFETGGDANGDQWDGWVLAFVPGEKKPVGTLYWTLWRGEHSIRMVEVHPDYQRSGIATELYKRLFRDQGITKRDLQPGYQTDAGAAFRRSLRASMPRTACIIAAGTWGGSRCLLKNRDRNYEPEIRIYHEVREGLEVLYAKDESTGWVEGINEKGIAAVNSSLQVIRDEAERDIVNTVGKKNKDGARILKVLEQGNLDDAIEQACNYKKGIKGHTFLTSPDKTVSIEHIPKHDCIVKTLNSTKIHVRTNHGFSHEDAGYPEDSKDYASSVARRDQAKKILRGLETPEEVASAVFGKRRKDRESPLNMVRDTDNMRTTSQLVMNVTKKELLFYIIPGKVKYLGYENKLPKDHKPKLTLQVFEYTDLDEDGTFDVAKKIKKSASVIRVAERWVDKCPGGLADKKTPSDFDAGSLEKGIKVEMEHTDDPQVAKEITMDHLTEDPEYYVKLEKMEKAGSRKLASLASLRTEIQLRAELEDGGIWIVVSDQEPSARDAAFLGVPFTKTVDHFRDQGGLFFVPDADTAKRTNRVRDGLRGLTAIIWVTDVELVGANMQDLFGHRQGLVKLASEVQSREAAKTVRLASRWIQAEKFGPNTPLMEHEGNKVKYRIKATYNGILCTVYYGKTRIGWMDAYRLSYPETDACRKQVWDLLEKYPQVEDTSRERWVPDDGVPRTNTRALVVDSAFINDESKHGLGIGKAMYLAIAAEWFDREGPFLFMPMNCKGHGNTSDAAKRVWASLAKMLPSSGNVIAILKRPMLPSQMKLAYRTATVDLKGLVKGFLSTQPHLDTLSCDATKGKCDGVSSRLFHYLTDQGVKAKVVEGRGLLESLGAEAHPDWISFVDGDTRNLAYLSHVVVVVGRTVIDLTSAQFGQTRGVVFEPLSDFRKRWKSLRDFTAWGKTAEKAKFKKKKEVPKADGKGTTTVYEYSEGQIQHRHREKATRIEKLRGSIADIRAQVKKDLKSKDESTRLTALAVGLIDHTYERVGNPGSAKEGHFGVTGWRPEHVKFSGSNATIKYVGKSGVDHEKKVTDAALVSALKEAVKDKKKDQSLFECDDCTIDASSVNAYLEDFDITAKDIRGLHANQEVQDRLKAIRSKGGKLPEDKKEQEKKLKEEFGQAVDEAAEAVGHEAATLRSQYLVPGMEEDFLKDGTVTQSLKKKASAPEILVRERGNQISVQIMGDVVTYESMGEVHSRGPVGWVNVEKAPSNRPLVCQEDANAMRAQVPLKGIYMVTASHLQEDMRGQGIGKLLYERALQEAASRGCAIMPEHCWKRGMTTPSALRVWASLKRRHFAVGDLVWGGAVIRTGSRSRQASGTWFHGTTEAGARAILRGGFDKALSGARQNTLHSKVVAEGRGVFLTDDRQQAEWYAGGLASPGAGGGAVVEARVQGRIMTEKDYWKTLRLVFEELGIGMYDPRRQEGYDELAQRIQEMGYVGFYENSSEILVFDSKRIQVAGAFYGKGPYWGDKLRMKGASQSVSLRLANFKNLKPNDRMTVYHGTSISYSVALVNGFDATKLKSRQYGGPTHRGLFVAPDPETAKHFSSYGRVVLEMVVQAKNLHGTDFSGVTGRNDPQREEIWRDKFPNSFRPYLSLTLSQHPEPQALLQGLVSPAQIKRIWYAPETNDPGQWYTRKEFLGLGLEIAPPYGQKKPLRDFGVDLSYPKYTYAELLAALSVLLGSPERPMPLDKIKRTLDNRLEVSLIPDRSDVLAEIIERAGFEPRAAKGYADLLRKQRQRGK